MSGARWEYASVVWEQRLQKVTKSDSRYERIPFQTREEARLNDWRFLWWKIETIFVWLPGAVEAEERISWETGDEKARVRVHDVYNELGADGWEMIESGVRSSAMGPGFGRDTTSFPVRTTAWFKRPARASQS